MWQGVEATLFATLMSILNGGSFAGSALGSGLTAAFGVTATNFTLLAPLIAVSMLLPEPFHLPLLCNGMPMQPFAWSRAAYLRRRQALLSPAQQTPDRADT